MKNSGKVGIATEVTKLMCDYLFKETDIEIITATTMVENGASAHVLEKNGFMSTHSIHKEDWGPDKAGSRFSVSRIIRKEGNRPSVR